MSDTLLTLQLDKPSMLMSSSSMLDEDPMLDFLSSKHVFFLSSIGDGGMKVPSSCSKGLMVTVISGWGLCGQGHAVPFVWRGLEGRVCIGILVSRDCSTLETSGARLKCQ